MMLTRKRQKLSNMQQTAKIQQIRHPLCLTLLIITLLLITCSCVNSFAVKTCDNVGTFQQILDISLPMCAEECFRRQRCHMYMFRFGMNYCALKDNINLSSLKESDPVCVYFAISDWLPKDLGTCKGNTCNVTERCLSKTECQKSECPKPDEISDSKLLSITQSIGKTNRYKCNNGFLGYGNPTITCGDDGMWSETDFKCISILSCPVPNQHYFNADLTHVEGSLYTAGTVLTFTCREGYQKTGDVWKSTCQKSLRWDSERICCCPESSTHRLDASCKAIIDGEVATSYTGARDFCKSIGGNFIWTNWKMAALYDENTTDFVIQPRKVSSIAKVWNYTGCAADNGAEGDPSKSLKDKVDTVVNNDWQGSNCRWGRIWFPGQPDLSPHEDCMIRFVHEPGIKHHDSPCTFNENNDVGFACGFNIPRI